jgi:hypothetical protein
VERASLGLDDWNETLWAEDNPLLRAGDVDKDGSVDGNDANKVAGAALGAWLLYQDRTTRPVYL